MSPLDKDSIDMLSEVGPELLSGSLLTGWTIPTAVKLEEKWIRFYWANEEEAKFALPLDSGLAGEFATLCDQTPEFIADFASEWGPLRICSHGVWHWRSDTCRIKRLAYGKNRFRESIGTWRLYARAVKAMLNAGVALRNGLPMDRKDWWSFSLLAEPQGDLKIDQATHPLPWERYTGAQKFDLRIQRRVFLAVLDRWVACLGIRPRLMWYEEEETPQLILSQGSLLESVLAHVLFAVSGTRSLVTCANCGRIYHPTRAPRSGEQHYCQLKTCGRDAAVRNASTKYRPKKEKPDG